LSPPSAMRSAPRPVAFGTRSCASRRFVQTRAAECKRGFPLRGHLEARRDGGVRGALRRLLGAIRRSRSDSSMALQAPRAESCRLLRTAPGLLPRVPNQPPPFRGYLTPGILATAMRLGRCDGASGRYSLRRYSSASPPRSVTPADALLGREHMHANPAPEGGDYFFVIPQLRDRAAAATAWLSRDPAMTK
jgi:hypothetical protein